VKSERRVRLDQPPPALFQVRTALRRTAPARWLYRRRWHRRADVALLSFPKAGRTWLRALLVRALAEHFGVTPAGPLDLRSLAARDVRIPRIRLKHDDAPQLKTAAELVSEKDEYRDVRVVLLVRDPRDLVVSTYFQMTRREGRYRGDLASFLRCPRGSLTTILEFFNIWARNTTVPRDFRLIRYEDLHRDPVRELRGVLEFAGLRGVAPAVLESAVSYASFENLHRLEAGGEIDTGRLRPGDPSDLESFKTRRGIIGGFRDYLNAEQIAWLDRRIAAELDPLYRYA